MTSKGGLSRPDATGKTVFRFHVRLISGPVAPSYVKKHPDAPSRVIDIRGSQSLDMLHQAIFRAFDRYDPHMYEFQIGGKKPMDRKAARYSVALDGDDPEEKGAETATIASLRLKLGTSFFYWFDFGDDWWHEVILLAIDPPAQGTGRFPRIVEKNGDSPPQYVDWDGEEASIAEELLSEDDMTAGDSRRLGEISALIQEFCQKHLTEGYAEACMRLLDAVIGAWLPLERGKTTSWAAGLVHATGMINFLHDPAFSPHMKLRDIAPHFGVSAATMENKSREIRDAVNAFPLDPRFCLEDNLADNPLAWLQQVNGFIADMRTQPRDVQKAALAAGQNPFIPAAPKTPGAPKQKRSAPAKKASGKSTQASRAKSGGDTD